MERSAKQKFLEQERLRPNYDLRPDKPSELPRLISAIAFMGVLMLVVAATYLSKGSEPNARARAESSVQQAH
jgi:hypothetical protein